MFIPKLLKAGPGLDPSVKTWTRFARINPGFSYGKGVLRWTNRFCEDRYETHFGRAIARIKYMIDTRDMPPLTAVEVRYCALVDDLECIARSIGDAIPGLQRISITAHGHRKVDDSVVNSNMCWEFQSDEFQKLPWEIEVIDSFGATLEYDPDYEGGGY